MHGAVASRSRAVASAWVLIWLPCALPPPLLGVPQEWQVCQVTVGVLGDVCRAIEDGIFPFCDAIMQARPLSCQGAVGYRHALLGTFASGCAGVPGGWTILGRCSSRALPSRAPALHAELPLCAPSLPWACRRC